MPRISVESSRKRQVIDITDQVAAELVGKAGMVHVFLQHTTAALRTADLDPGTDADLLDFLELLTPSHHTWRHPHDPQHAPDHLLASLIGTSITIPYSDQSLLLGSWQRIIVVELDGPRQRSLVVQPVPLH